MSKGYKYFNGKKWVHGNAALLHVISEDGGLEAHYNKVVKKAIKSLIDEANQEMARPALRVVNGGKE